LLLFICSNAPPPSAHYIFFSSRYSAVSCNIPSGYTAMCKVYLSTVDHFVYGLVRPLKTNT